MSAIIGRMTRAQVKKAIWLSGIDGDYKVHHDVPGEAIVCHVPSTAIGNLIVRALRERQYDIIHQQKERSRRRTQKVTAEEVFSNPRAWLK